ncbi:hypothetical protein H4R18_003116 [Coemansia javaensis]|uniref:LITAF domain-containing protein n=1 Tax=Coemansia javaensis TaxID=2761396 RepID=A0A9W8LI66_9FUNG|nr:hypothetical protein H4R18_003116 [Coemansia javaensis]
MHPGFLSQPHMDHKQPPSSGVPGTATPHPSAGHAAGPQPNHHHHHHSGHDYGYGGGPMSSYGRYSRSSIFVPADWNIEGTKAGFVDFIGRVVRQLDHQYTSDGASSQHHGYGHGHGRGYGHAGHGHAGHGHPGHGHLGHGHPGYGHAGHGHGYGGMGRHSMYGMHPGASMVSIAHDPHGMFAHPGTMSRMSMAHGRAHFSSKAVPTTCPRCQRDIMTLVRRRPNALNVAAATGAVVAGVLLKLPMAMLPLAMLPLQVKALQPKIHYCPRCNYKFGKNVKITVPLDH